MPRRGSPHLGGGPIHSLIVKGTPKIAPSLLAADFAHLADDVAKIEAHHRARYKKIIKMVEAGSVYKREQPIKWKCGVCGYIVEGTEPPPKCPSCKHSKEHFEPANMDFG